MENFISNFSNIWVYARARVPNSKPTQISIFWWEYCAYNSHDSDFDVFALQKRAKKNRNCRNKYQKNIKMCPCPLSHSRDESQTRDKTTNGQLNHQHHSDDGMQKLSVFFYQDQTMNVQLIFIYILWIAFMFSANPRMVRKSAKQNTRHKQQHQELKWRAFKIIMAYAAYATKRWKNTALHLIDGRQGIEEQIISLPHFPFDLKEWKRLSKRERWG